MASFFTFPLSDLSKTIDAIASSVRTLPDSQFEAELEELRKCDGLASKVMLRLYEIDAERRVSPEHKFDIELEVTLGRLEQATTPSDRDRVAAIGSELKRIGGQAAQQRARARMIEAARPARRELRASILDKRWA